MTPHGDARFNRDRRAMLRAAKSAPTPRAAIAAMPAPARAIFRPEIRRQEALYASRDGGGEKRPYTPRGEGFRKDGDRPQGDRPYRARPSRDGDRPVAIVPTENLAATRNFHAARRTVVHARILAPDRAAQGSRRSRRFKAMAEA